MPESSNLNPVLPLMFGDQRLVYSSIDLDKAILINNLLRLAHFSRLLFSKCRLDQCSVLQSEVTGSSRYVECKAGGFWILFWFVYIVSRQMC